MKYILSVKWLSGCTVRQEIMKCTKNRSKSPCFTVCHLLSVYSILEIKYLPDFKNLLKNTLQ